MSIPESEPHVAAVIAKLKAEVPVLIKVADGVGPAADPPYLAVYPDAGDVEDPFLSGNRSKLTIGFIINAVGAGPQQARWALDKARLVMLSSTPVAVAGRKTHRMRQTLSGVPIVRDESTQPPLYIATAGFRLMSQTLS